MARVNVKEQLCRLVVVEVVGAEDLDPSDFEYLLDRELLCEKFLFTYDIENKEVIRNA